MSDVRGKSKLSADERAFLNRIRSLNEEETKNLSFDDMVAYLNPHSPDDALNFGAACAIQI